VALSSNKTPKKLFLKKIKKRYKNAEFHADFKLLKNLQKNSRTKVIDKNVLYTVLNMRSPSVFSPPPSFLVPRLESRERGGRGYTALLGALYRIGTIPHQITSACNPE
jgi:hypothetical protein